MRELKYLIVVFLCLRCSSLTAQTDFSAATWHFIDTSIFNERNLADLSVIVDNLKIKALGEKKYFYAARCYNYQLRIKDLKTEDTLFFKNSAFIDEMLSQQQPAEMLFSLHMLQAHRLFRFREKFKRYAQIRYKRKDIPINYAAFTSVQTDSIVRLHLEKAKEIAKQLDNIDANDALWLSSDPTQFLFKPGLYDIAIAEQVRQTDKNITIKTQWLTFSVEEFSNMLDSVYHSDKKTPLRLKYYGEWMNYRKTNPSAFYFIESLVRKDLYGIVKQRLTGADKIYESYLKQIVASQYTPVKAHGVFQLCLLWHNLSENYFPLEEGSYDRGGIYKLPRKNFDTTYRYHSVKALDLFKANKNLIANFSYLDNILLQMEKKILRAEFGISMQQNNLPGEPILTELKFKNTDTLYYKIVKQHPGFDFSYEVTPVDLIFELLNKPVIKQSAIDLPTTDDHNYHNSYLKIDELPAGKYVLLYSNKSVMDTISFPHYVSFNVTNIAVINSDKRVYVLHRNTGKPLADSKVQALYYKDVSKGGEAKYKTLTKNYIVNKSGYIEIENDNYDQLIVNYGDDTIHEFLSFNEYSEPDEVYIKEDYDGLVEYYEENATAYVYTDRSIYRPGQTVFYKAIFITKNKDTGEPILMSQKNLKGKLFRSVYKKWLKKEEPWLIVKDPFNREMDSLKIVPNEFGSISGSFKIPKTAATGEWAITPDYIDLDYGTGTFRVEEYKRPTYEINIEKPQKELLPGDEFIFRVKIRSFAGASLNNVKVNYTVSRTFYKGLSEGGKSDDIDLSNISKNDTIFQTAGYTNNDGELEVLINDSQLKNYKFDKNIKWDFTYSINAEAIDATGESYETKANVNISTQPVLIKIPLQAKYNRSKLEPVVITAEDKNAGIVSKNINLKFYRLIKDDNIYNDHKLLNADIWLYDSLALQKQFPFEKILQAEPAEKKELVFEKNINTGEKEKLVLDDKIFAAGNYLMEAVCKIDDTVRGKVEKEFSVYDLKENKLPERSWSFYHLPVNSVSPGDTLNYYFGNSEDEIYTIFHVVYYAGNKKTTVKYFYDEQQLSKGIHVYPFKTPMDAIDRIDLTQVYILRNQVFIHTENLYITGPDTDEPEIIVEKYRKKLSPGSKEIFSVSIKTKNENIAAELMTTMYDASLDKLEEHKWTKPPGRDFSSLDISWTDRINNKTNNWKYLESLGQTTFLNPGHSTSALSWANPRSNFDEDVMGDFTLIERRRVANQGFYKTNFGSYDLLDADDVGYFAGRTSGWKVYDPYLSEVVVGYGVKKNLTESVISIRGTSNLSGYAQPLIILDGEIYNGDLSTLDPNIITQGIILKGADATSLYGSKASNGVLVLSTKGEIVFPKEQEPVLVTRKNFNESAFFFPSIYADKNGSYTFNFTMPESVTEWNWKILAHTRSSRFAYAEKKLNTQLPLMVQPNMPRLLYQGDRIVLQSRITNLDSTDASGKIICKIEDAVTGDDITAALVTITQKNFSVIKKSNIAEAFEIRIPQEQLNPLKIIITVRSESFADGEEHIIPILSPAVFVRENISFSFINKDTSIQVPAIPADAKFFGAGLNIQPKPQSALIYSLPYLANYPYSCAEQNFNKLLAHITGLKLMRSDGEARLSFDKANKFVEKNDKTITDKLSDIPAEETMPWLVLTNKEALMQKQLFNLLDTLKNKSAIEELLDKIYKSQTVDGGLTWFAGGKSDFYISNYVLRGFGKMTNDNLLIPYHVFNSNYNSFIKKLVDYCDNVIEKQLINKSRNDLYYIYARSYWLKTFELSDSILDKLRKRLVEEWKKPHSRSLYEQSLLIISSFRLAKNNEDELHKKAMAQIESIRQLAIEDEQNGLRWKKLADEDDLSMSSEETIVLLAEAFTEAGRGSDVHNGIIKWLLTAKNDHNWRSTKATAASIDLLAKQNNNITGITQTISATINEQKISVTNDLLSGHGFAFAQTSKQPRSISLQKQNTINASGNINWYYFTSSGELSKLNKEIALDKKYSRWNDKDNKWDILTGNEALKISDKIKVVVSIRTTNNLQYVFIDDKRASAFEPVMNSSGYEYADAISYYRSVRDAGFLFFSDFIPAGMHEISYELKVAYEGNFSCSPVVLQCMYKPELVAYGNNAKFVCEK